ncbi:MAG: hypothetical protein N2559_13240, partial [Anaerolineae bacterium]|nr:hypothetical protein [Anaerolineae bacterium]
MNIKKYRADLFALGAYFVLALILTYPLVLHLTTHVPGDGSDDPALAWNLWWVPYALINLGTSPIYCNYMFFPIGLNLAFYTLTYLNAFLSIPIQYAFNLVIAANVNVWFSFVVGGWGAYLLVKFLLRDWRLEIRDFQSPISNLYPLAAFAAGALYAFSSNKFLYVSLGQFNIASSHWIPFYVLFLLKVTDERRMTNDERVASGEWRVAIYYGALLGLFLLFQALSEFIYASFLIIFTAIYLAYWLITRRPKLLPFAFLLLTFLVAAITFTLPMSPILAAMFQDMMTEGDFIQQGLGFADVFSSDVFGFFVPSRLHPIFGGLEARFDFAYTNFAYLGFVALALALIALWKIPQARIWGVFGAIFILISLGPELRVNGPRFDLLMPFDLLLEIPFVKGNRYPSRWSVMVTLALAVLVGYGFAWLLTQLSRLTHYAIRSMLRIAYSVVLFGLIFEHLATPLPLSDMRIPDVYHTIARDEGDFTVLEIPLAWRNGYRMTGTLDQAMMFAQWYQTAHRRPILGGNTSRNPEFKFQYFTEAPVINSIIAVETGHEFDDGLWYNNRKIAPYVLHFFGVRYVVWHSPRDPANRAALDNARKFIELALPITQFYDSTDETGHTIAYRVREITGPVGQTIRADDYLARLNFAEGWGAFNFSPIWATRRQAKILVRLDTPRDATLTLRAFAPMSNQRVTLNINGSDVGNLALQTGWGEYSLNVKHETWRAGMNQIVLQFDALAPVTSVRAGNYGIGATSITAPVSIVARSAGSEIGDFAHIYVNGVDVAKNSRGYNIVVVNEQSGAIEASAAFDTFASRNESARLAQFIAQIPNGRIVAVAVRDEASRYLTQEAVDALRAI